MVQSIDLKENPLFTEVSNKLNNIINKYLLTLDKAVLKDLQIPADILKEAESIRAKKLEERGGFSQKIFWIKNDKGEGKLVRDKIPDIIRESENRESQIRIMENDEYQKELRIKLGEELKEFLEIQDTSEYGHKIEELADLLEVINALLQI